MAVFPSGASQDAFCKEVIVRLFPHNLLARIFFDGYGCGPVSQWPLADRLSGSALQGIVLSDAPLAMRRPKGTIASIPEERRVKVGTSLHRFEVKALSNWTEPELTAIYLSLGAGSEDFAATLVMDSADTCKRIPLLIPPWKSDMSYLEFPLDLIIVLHIWQAGLSPSPLAGPLPAEQPVGELNFWKVVTTCIIWDSKSWYLSRLHPGDVVYGFEEHNKLRLPGSLALSYRPWNDGRMDGKDGYAMLRCGRTRALHFERFTSPIVAGLDLGA